MGTGHTRLCLGWVSTGSQLFPLCPVLWGLQGLSVGNEEALVPSWFLAT